MFLYIDTTGEIGYLKILDRALNQVAVKELVEKKDLAEKILSEIDLLLKENDLSADDLPAILVNPGPGSYTGLRIGITSANLIGFSKNIPVISFSGNGDEDCVISQVKLSKFESPANEIYAKPPLITKSKHGL